MQIIKFQQKVEKLVRSLDRPRALSPTINQMTAVFLIHRGEVSTFRELMDVTKMDEQSARRLCAILGKGMCSGRQGYQFIETIPAKGRTSHNDPRVRLRLTKNGKKFARMIEMVLRD